MLRRKAIVERFHKFYKKFGKKGVVFGAGWLGCGSAYAVWRIQTKMNVLYTYQSLIRQVTLPDHIEIRKGNPLWRAHWASVLPPKDEFDKEIVSLELECNNDIRVFISAQKGEGEDSELLDSYADDLDDIDDELLGENRDYAFYWERPWELKLLFQRKIANGLAMLFGRENEEGDIDDLPQEASSWTIETAFYCTSTAVLPEHEASSANRQEVDPDTDIGVHGISPSPHTFIHPLVGDPSCHRAYEKLTNPTGVLQSFPDRSRRRLKNFVCIVGTASTLVGAWRVVRMYRLKRTFGFARNYVRTSKEVVSLFGENASLFISHSRGKLTPTYIDATFSINGKAIDASFLMVAKREASTKQWRVMKQELDFSQS